MSIEIDIKDLSAYLVRTAKAVHGAAGRCPQCVVGQASTTVRLPHVATKGLPGGSSFVVG